MSENRRFRKEMRRALRAMHRLNPEHPEQAAFTRLETGFRAMELCMRGWLLQRYEIDRDRYLSGFRGIQVAAIPTINGCVVPENDWKHFTVCINGGLATYLHGMSKLVVGAMRVVGDDGIAVQRPQSEETIALVAKTYLECFWNGQVGMHRTVDVLRFTEQQVILASLLTTYMEWFVLAHELGHICCHVGAVFPPELARGQLMGETIAQDPEPRRIAGWGEEIAADLIGLNCLMRADEMVASVDVDSSDRDIRSDLLGMQAALMHYGGEVIRFAAVDLFLILIEMAEHYYEARNGRPCELGSHPPAVVRRAAVRDQIRTNRSTMFHLGDKIGVWAHNVVRGVCGT